MPAAAPGNRRTPATSNISGPAEISMSSDSTPGRATRINKWRSLSNVDRTLAQRPRLGGQARLEELAVHLFRPLDHRAGFVSDRRSSNKPLK